MKSVKNNLGYQTLYQLLSTGLPLITTPYLSRALGAESLGIFSYTQSVVNYFLLVAMLGVVNYGSRTIAACGEDKTEVSRSFWGIYSFQALLSCATIAVYYGYVAWGSAENRVVACLQGLYLLGALLDINWLFFGVEDFKITVTRNMAIKIGTVCLLLLLVKGPEDLWLYTLIMAGGTLLSQAVLWFFAARYIDFAAVKSITMRDIQRHIKPNLVLFVPLAAMSIFRTMDKTMLGLLSDYTQTGYYYNSDKLVNIPLAIINGMGTVMLPHMSALEGRGDKKGADHIFSLSVQGIAALSCAMAFGIAAVSKEFVPVFFGKGYEKCVLLTTVFTPILVLKALSQTVRMQYLVPRHKENYFIYSVLVGALVNLVVNFFLISKYGAMGAVIATIIAESIVMVLQFYFIRKEYDVCGTMKKCVPYVLIGAVMLFAVNAAGGLIENVYLTLCLKVFMGIGIYGLLCLLYWKGTKSELLRIIVARRGK